MNNNLQQRGGNYNRDHRDHREHRDYRNKNNYDGNRRYKRYNNENKNRINNYEEYSEQYDYARKLENDPAMTRVENIVVSKEVVDKKRDKFDLIFQDYIDELKEKNALTDEIENRLLALRRGIYSYGFDKPTPIQSLMIPQIIRGKDCLSQSQSGTGKTGAFVISMLALIDEQLHKPQVIILSPTHELANQTLVVAKEIGKKMNIRYSFTAGGTDRQQNVEELASSCGAQIVVATPGRLIDMMKHDPELFYYVKLLVIDEFDALLNGEFKKDIQFIIKMLDNNVLNDIQICLFSATLDQQKVDIANKILTDPVKVLILKEHITLECIEQRYVEIDNDSDKFSCLIDLLAHMPVEQFLVYVNTISKAEELQEKLALEGIESVHINGDQLKSKRAEIVRDFRMGKAKCLISTDVLSRGIDIPQLTFVLNYDIPPLDNVACYIHRIGRSGRNGKKGLAINFVTRDEYNILNMIQLTFNCQIKELESDFSIFNL